MGAEYTVPTWNFALACTAEVTGEALTTVSVPTAPRLPNGPVRWNPGQSPPALPLGDGFSGELGIEKTACHTRLMTAHATRSIHTLRFLLEWLRPRGRVCMYVHMSVHPSTDRRTNRNE